MSIGRRQATRAVALVGLLLLAPDATAEKRKGTFEPEGRISVRQFVQIDDAKVPVDYPEDPDSPAPMKPLGVVPAITTIDADLRLRRIQGSGIGFLVDAEFRHDLTDTLSDPLPLADNRLRMEFGERRDRSLGRLRGDLYVKSAYAEYEGLGGFDLRLGRMLMYDLGQTWVDGLHIRRPLADDGRGSGLEFGVFGGLTPNPLTYAFDTDYQGGGAHIRWQGEQGHVGLSSTFSMYEGKKDRLFINSAAHWQLVDGLFLSYNATADLYAFKERDGALLITTKPQVTNAFANIAWWATPQVQFRLSGALYRNVALVSTQRADLDGVLAGLIDRQTDQSVQKEQAELAQDVYDRTLGRFVDQTPYYRGMLTTVFKFLGHYYVYNELGLRYRERDESDGSTIGFGVRDTDFAGTGTFVHTRFRFRDAFASDSSEILVDMRRQFGGLLTAGASISHLAGRSLALDPPYDLLVELGRNAALQAQVQRLEQRQDVTMLSAHVDLDITSRLFLTLAYDLTLETPTEEQEDGFEGDANDLTIQAFNARVTWRL